MGGNTPKQYLTVNGKPLLAHTLEKMMSLGARELILVLSAGDERFRQVPQTGACTIVRGGKSRMESVLNALRAMQVPDDAWVMVHDGARPCVRREDVLHLVDVVGEDDVGGLLAVPVSDTVKRAASNTAGAPRVTSTVDRDALWLAQTPQMFRYRVLRSALERADDEGFEVTDEASAVERLGHWPLLVKGHKDNIKVTTPEDLILAGRYLAERGRP